MCIRDSATRADSQLRKQGKQAVVTRFQVRLRSLRGAQVHVFLHGEVEGTVTIQRLVLVPEATRDAGFHPRLVQMLPLQSQVDLVASRRQQGHVGDKRLEILVQLALATCETQQLPLLYRAHDAGQMGEIAHITQRIDLFMGQQAVELRGGVGRNREYVVQFALQHGLYLVPLLFDDHDEIS